MTTVGVPRPDPEERRRRSLRTTVRDMVLSMLVIVGIVVVWNFLVPRPERVLQPTVDVANAASGAVERLGFAPAVPQGLPEGWRPTQAQVLVDARGVRTWSLRYDTPDGGYAGLKQAEGADDRWEQVQTAQGEESGTRDVEGRTWVVRDGSRARSLVLRGAGVTTVVTTSGTDTDPAALARVLDLSGPALPAG